VNSARLLRRSLRHHGRLHLAVAAGVALAVAVLSGALAVGDSVRASLRTLALTRLGAATHALQSSAYVRMALAEELSADPDVAAHFGPLAPALALEAAVTHADSGRRAAPIMLFGVEARFFGLHGQAAPAAFEGRTVAVGAGLAAELGAQPGDALVLRVAAPEDIPASSLYGRKDPGRSLRVTLGATLPAEALGEFGLRPQAGAARVLFMPLLTLQRLLARPGQVNLLLARARQPDDARATAQLDAAVRRLARIEDLGVRLRPAQHGTGLMLETRQALVPDALVASTQGAAATLGAQAEPVLVGLANDLRSDGRSVPYSLVAGLTPEALRRLPDAPTTLPPEGIILNTWAARELGAVPGTALTLESYDWREQGRLLTRRDVFTVAGIVPLRDAAADRSLAPEYPGISDSAHLADWDPPFPVDLQRVRPQDERYWDEWRATPKAFVSLAAAQRLWGHRLGRATSVRVALAHAQDAARFEHALRAGLDPGAFGLRVEGLRAQALAAARGATDFGAYFVAFSAFLVGAALLLCGLFFRLGVEGRLREAGLLRALGFAATHVRRLLFIEGASVALLGTLVGLAFASLYGAGLLLGLRTIWFDALGTRALALHVTPGALAGGALAGLAMAALTLALTLRALRGVTPRALLGGRPESLHQPSGRWAIGLAYVALGSAAVLLAAAASERLPAVVACFGAGAGLLVAGLARLWSALVARARRSADASAPRGLLALALRNACACPGRSLLGVALIAAATFLLVAAGSFRREGDVAHTRAGGTGGYALVAEAVLPLVHDPAPAAGRLALGLDSDPATLARVAFDRFRLLPGDDVSCLGLYGAQRPRLLGATPEFIAAGRFAFAASLARDPAERANPWRLLEAASEPSVLPAIVDQNSLTYVLQRRLGDMLELPRPGAAPLRLRLVAALRDSLFQSEVIVSEAALLRAFPDQAGYRFFLIDAPPEASSAAAATLERALADHGFDARPAAERVQRFQRVENTYISTFQVLGALGLVLGTTGLAALLLRNALERRRELALLAALGFDRRRRSRLLLLENALVVSLGLALGALAALVAVAPALWARGQWPGGRTLVLLLGAVPAVATLASWLAVRAVARWPLVASLRSEVG
jgi:ABC-type lipoprotein release transport system permease subunit